MKPDDHATDQAALIMGASGVVLRYGTLVERSRRIARLLRAAGLAPGEALAVALENRPEFLELAWAAHRIGLYFVPVDWHLLPDEAAYIVADCGAQAFAASDRLTRIDELAARLQARPRLRLQVSGAEPWPGFVSYEAHLARHSGEPLEDELDGQPMLYSSGTTGRPKGVKRPLGGSAFGATTWTETLMQRHFGVDRNSVFLVAGPLYHAAPLVWSMSAQRLGATLVVMERFDPEAALQLIERHRVTHALMVPTHFVRMLKLDQSRRALFDLSSLRAVVHASAPCPIEVKERMLAWLGPIVHEFYSCTEGVGFAMIGPDEWRAHRGSVGRPLGCKIAILDHDGNELPPGEAGLVYFEGSGKFVYYNDPDKSAAVFDAAGRATVGDIGYLDADGYLYLTDRASQMIISGGVNIYPQEAENVLALHPEIVDVAVLGVPNEEFGEEVKAVVVPVEASRAGPELASRLVDYGRSRLAHYKCPPSVDFVDQLPRLASGKLAKRLLRNRYWRHAEAAAQHHHGVPR
ncbi:MAG TPA: AMP-binding protein [Burkholderiaceae bacterium]|nr:AMP-binding protein [Burkholderiaceae bacterium]